MQFFGFPRNGCVRARSSADAILDSIKNVPTLRAILDSIKNGVPRAILDSIKNARRHPNGHGSLCARIVQYHPGHGPYLIRFEPGTGRSAGYLLTITPYIHNICRHVRVRFQRSAFRAICKSRNMYIGVYRGGAGRRDSAFTQVKRWS